MADSPFTPTYQPFRPQGTGWMAYHDVAPASGPSGIAISWRLPSGNLMWAAVLDRVLDDGRVTASGRLDEGQDLCEVLANAMRGTLSRFMTEQQVFALILPHPDHHPDPLVSAGMPPLEERIADVRRAVAWADMRSSMREALEACLDHGVPRDVPLSRMRERTREREWPALALAARHPMLARVALTVDREALAGDSMPALMERWPGMTPAHLRRLRETGWQAATFPGACMDLLMGSPVDWWPRSKEAWLGLGEAAGAVAAIAKASGPGVPRDALAASSGGDWAGLAARMRAASGLPAVHEFGASLAEKGGDCWDPVSLLAMTVTIPLLASRERDGGVMNMEYDLGGRPLAKIRDSELDEGSRIVAALAAAQRLLYAGKGAPAVLELSRRWHERQAALRAGILGGDGGATWPPLIEGEWRVGDVGVVAIRDSASLREEGDRGPDRDGVAGLDHCVATRLGDCLTGAAHVLSVRAHAPDGTWRRLSTCQVSVEQPDRGPPRVTVTEHRGHRNGTVPQDAALAVTRLVKAIQRRQVPITPAALLPRERPSGGSITRRCGYDWRSPGAIDRAVAAWEPLLPRWARGLGADGLHDALVERGLLDWKPPPIVPVIEEDGDDIGPRP